MIKGVVHSITAAVRMLFGTVRSLAMFVGFYLALLLLLYAFVTTREANMTQVVLTFVLAIAATASFFSIQALAIQSMHSEQSTSARFQHALRACWKLMVVSVVPCLIIWLVLFLLDKIWLSTSDATPGMMGSNSISQPPQSYVSATSFPLKEVSVTSLRILLLGFALPLVVIHLWIGTAQSGLLTALKECGATMKRAFAPQGVLIYMIGLVVFAIIPHYLIFLPWHVNNTWMEVTLLGGRDALAVMCVLFGWTVTVGALSEINRVNIIDVD